MATGRVTDAAGAQAWISGVLRAGAGRTDAILLGACLDEEADFDALADLARALAGSSERWIETRDQGAALAATLAQLGEGDGAARAYPIVLGSAARGLALEPRLVVAMYLQAFAATLVSAAVRFVPLGQAVGQGILADLRPVIEDVTARALEDGLDGIGQAAFGADLAAMEHEGLDVRIFRT